MIPVFPLMELNLRVLPCQDMPSLIMPISHLICGSNLMVRDVISSMVAYKDVKGLISGNLPRVKSNQNALLLLELQYSIAIFYAK